jgi:hypothetical protein
MIYRDLERTARAAAIAVTGTERHMPQIVENDDRLRKTPGTGYKAVLLAPINRLATYVATVSSQTVDGVHSVFRKQETHSGNAKTLAT